VRARRSEQAPVSWPPSLLQWTIFLLLFAVGAFALYLRYGLSLTTFSAAPHAAVLTWGAFPGQGAPRTVLRWVAAAVGFLLWLALVLNGIYGALGR
jgi:hypothetical protein